MIRVYICKQGKDIYIIKRKNIYEIKEQEENVRKSDKEKNEKIKFIVEKNKISSYLWDINTKLETWLNLHIVLNQHLKSSKN